MVGRLRAAIPIVLALAALVAGPTLAAADSERGGGGLAALSAIVATLQINGIEPLVRSPVAGGDEPFFIALLPVDSDAAQAAAAAWNLRRLQPTEGGERLETMILPRPRPARADEAEASESAPTPPKATPVTATSDAYRKYIADLTYIAKLRLDDPKNLRRAQQLLVNHSLISLARAWIAQSSEIAARTQDFIGGVDTAADKNGGPDSLKSTISKQPFTVLDFPGWQNASLAIRKDLARDLALMAALAWRFSEIAYGRAGGEAHYAQEANKGNLTAAAPAGSPSPASVSASPQLSDRAKPLMTQMLALGAHLHLSNQGTVGLDPAQSALATNKDNDQCLRWAQLNLDQCLAAARDNQERAYCLGKTGIEERSQCWSALLGPSR